MTQLYPPPMDPRTLTRQVWGVDSARRIPGVGKALDLIGGLMSQMPLDSYAGIEPMPRPRLLEQPDLDKVRPLFVRLHSDDYLLHGNAAHLITARGADGWPAAVRWYPAHAWHVQRDERSGARRYWLNGREVNADDVVHVQRGADPLNDCRGIGVVEQYVNALDRVALLDERQRTDTAGGYVPSVAVIAPEHDDSDEAELDEQASKWEQKFQGPGRRPVMLPYGTTVTPLAWSPVDSEAAAARGASLLDVANMFGLDGYWLGAPASSQTYRTPGPLFLVLMRTTLGAVLAPFEDTWSQRWLVRGRRVTFQREAVLGDDFATQVQTLATATGGPVMTTNEGRSRLALGPVPGGDVLKTAAPAGSAAPVADPNPTDPADQLDPAATQEDS